MPLKVFFKDQHRLMPPATPRCRSAPQCAQGNPCPLRRCQSALARPQAVPALSPEAPRKRLKSVTFFSIHKFKTRKPPKCPFFTQIPKVSVACFYAGLPRHHAFHPLDTCALVTCTGAHCNLNVQAQSKDENKSCYASRLFFFFLVEKRLAQHLLFSS